MQKKATTVLGRAVSTSVGSQNTVPAHQQNGAKNSLRDVILGGQDGLVNMLGIALGVIAGGGSNHILLVTGIAASITESISMGAVAYTSFGSDRDFYLAEKEREQDHVSSRPEEEREENCHCSFQYGGREIRTPGTVPRTAVFKTAGFNRSPIPPFSRILLRMRGIPGIGS